MFFHTRKSTTGESLPSWITSKGPAYLKQHVRHSKYDPLVEEVEILDVNPKYAHVQLPDGKTTTVSLKHLTCKPAEDIGLASKVDSSNTEKENISPMPAQTTDTVEDSQPLPVQQDTLRRSTRIRNAPAYLEDYER